MCTGLVTGFDHRTSAVPRRDAEPVRVVIVDDEALVRSGFELILNVDDGIDVVGTSDDTGAVDIVERTRPDIVLLDIRMVHRDGMTILRDLMARSPHLGVVMLTTFDADEHIAEALEAGARGFLLKDTDPELLPELVKTAARGGLVLSGAVGDKVVDRLRRGSPTHPEIDTLTGREREVLALVGTGLSNAEISSALGLTAATVKDHVSAILRKLNVDNRVQAALVAARVGLGRA